MLQADDSLPVLHRILAHGLDTDVALETISTGGKGGWRGVEWVEPPGYSYSHSRIMHLVNLVKQLDSGFNSDVTFKSICMKGRLPTSVAVFCYCISSNGHLGRQRSSAQIAQHNLNMIRQYHMTRNRQFWSKNLEDGVRMWMDSGASHSFALLARPWSWRRSGDDWGRDQKKREDIQTQCP